jgi:quercetin dioxygenase-like cupin family protein
MNPSNVTADTTHAPLWHMGSLFRWHATAKDTGGAYALAEIELRPGSEPPPHTHAHEEESFYILDGVIDFVVDGKHSSAGAGELVILPRGRTHAFRVRSERARALLCITPAGLEEAFFATSEPALRAELPPVSEGPPPRELIERVLSIQAARGVRFELGGAR